MSDYQIDPMYNGEDIMKVMRIIRTKIATYPKEITMLSRLNLDYVISIISYLIGEEYIEWVPLLDPYYMEERLEHRKGEMFAKGIRGFWRWSKFNWIGFRDWRLHYELNAIEKLKKEGK